MLNCCMSWKSAGSNGRKEKPPLNLPFREYCNPNSRQPSANSRIFTRKPASAGNPVILPACAPSWRKSEAHPNLADHHLVASTLRAKDKSTFHHKVLYTRKRRYILPCDSARRERFHAESTSDPIRYWQFAPRTISGGSRGCASILGTASSLLQPSLTAVAVFSLVDSW